MLRSTSEAQLVDGVAADASPPAAVPAADSGYAQPRGKTPSPPPAALLRDGDDKDPHKYAEILAAEIEETPEEKASARRMKRLILGAIVVLGVLVVGLGIVLGVYLRRSAASSSASADSVGAAGTTGGTATTTSTPTANPLGNYNYTGWTGGCQGCGAYGSYGGNGVVQSKGGANVFGVLLNQSDSVECNAYSIFVNLSFALDFTNATALNIGLRAPFLRALFHDAGTFSLAAYAAYVADPTDANRALVGGMDGSLAFELKDRGDNRGLEKAAAWVEELHARQSPNCPVISRADIYAMGAFIAASSPNYTYPYYHDPYAATQIAAAILLGRNDSGVANPTGRLPAANITAQLAVQHFADNYGFTAAETAAIVIGSHSLGGINIGGLHTDPPVGTQYPTFFLGSIRGPPATVHNGNFDQVMGQVALIPGDNQMKTFADTANYVMLFNRNLTAFYEVYYPTMVKMSLFGNDPTAMRVWTPPA